MSKPFTRRGITLLAAVGALLTVAFAAAPQADAATIYACVKKKGGSTRIVSKSTKCRRSEYKLSWNTSGRNGRNGTNGRDGANGKNGANGANGAAGASGKEGAKGSDGTALAFAHVSATGVLDTAHSKNVSVASNAATGIFCLKVDVPAVNVTATQDTANSGGEFGNVSAILSGQDPTNIIGIFCPVGDNVLIGTDRAGTNKNYAFWVNFN
jgi:hypothetical protein